MNERLIKVFNMKKILSAQDVQKKERIIHASKELSGLNLTELSASMRKKLEHHLALLNQIVKQYAIKTFEDYAQITDTHLDSMINILKRITMVLGK